MKRLVWGMLTAALAGVMVLLPARGCGGLSQAADVGAMPSIGQPLVRQGDFAVRLAADLGVGSSSNETEAESRLGEAGIGPRNGWIADYPMTPDIAVEVYNSVRAAADAGRIGMSAEIAAERFNNIMAQAGLSATASSVGTGDGAYAVSASAPGQAEMDDYYSGEGPPVITYYPPPPDYSYLYAWVPYPFWCSGFWFSGYFILNDFHRPVFVRHRHVFVSNHFRNIGGRNVARVDAVARLKGSPALTTGGTAGRGPGAPQGGKGGTPQQAPNRGSPVFRGTGAYRGRGAYTAPPPAPRAAVTTGQGGGHSSGSGGWSGNRAMVHSAPSGGFISRGSAGMGFHGGGGGRSR